MQCGIVWRVRIKSINPPFSVADHRRPDNSAYNEPVGCSSTNSIAGVRLFAQGFLLFVLHLPFAWAGGGPETTLVVVNAASPVSLTIANAYVQMRDIPESHVVWLDDVPVADSIDIETFRQRIWKPIHDFIAGHHLENEIDTIAYSADFPYRVDFKQDLKANRLRENRYLGHYASLTGLTFFAHRVERRSLGYVGVNHYFRRDLAPRKVPPRSLTNQEANRIRAALKALNHNDYKNAIESLQSVLKKYPWSADAWYQLARGLAATDQIKEAMEALSKAVNMGWANSLLARRDALLKPLRSYPGFSELVHHMRLKIGPFQPAHGFRSRYAWLGGDLPVVPSAGAHLLDRYYLSTLLAYTGLHGNSVPEALKYLAMAASGDGSLPDGTVYLMANSNVRAETRERSFYATVAALHKRGHRAEILSDGQDGQNGILPQNKQDVIGAVVGAQRYRWKRSHSRLLPGAIAESLTSYGGDFNRAYQTKLTEFLRFGAAGSSGAVAEPYSFQPKFPVPYLHVHYADGSSLAEAFYQSVEVPYQLLIVGEPLAQPFAHFADVRLAAPNDTRNWHDTVLLKPEVKEAKGHAIRNVELWVDGRYTDNVAPWDAFLWNSDNVEDGCHNIRLVAVEASPIETRSYVRLPVTVDNKGHRVEVKSAVTPVALGDDIRLSGLAPQAKRIEILEGTRSLGSSEVNDGQWKAAVPSLSLGLGKVPLYVRAFYPDGSTARDCGMFVDIGPPPRLPSNTNIGPGYKLGLEATVRDASDKNHMLVIKKGLTGRIRELRDLEKTAVSLRFTGEFKINEPGFYQFSVVAQGRLRVKVDGSLKANADVTGEGGGIYVPLNLDKGWHGLDIDFDPKGQLSLEAHLEGQESAVMLARDRVRHSASLN